MATRSRDKAHKLYSEKQTGAREYALEQALQEHSAAQGRVDDAAAQLAAIPDELPIDAMLDAGNALQRVLNDGGAPVNERLRQVFASFRMDTVEDEVVVEPVFAPRRDRDARRSIWRRDGRGARRCRAASCPWRPWI